MGWNGPHWARSHQVAKANLRASGCRAPRCLGLGREVAEALLLVNLLLLLSSKHLLLLRLARRTPRGACAANLKGFSSNLRRKTRLMRPPMAAEESPQCTNEAATAFRRVEKLFKLNRAPDKKNKKCAASDPCGLCCCCLFL